MKVERMARSGQISRQLAMRSRVFSWLRRRRIAFSTFGRRVLERNVEVGQDRALGHQRDHLVDMRIGIDVVQPHPDAERAERLGEIDEARLATSRRATRSARSGDRAP